MRLVADSGLWSTHAPQAPTPAVAVLEVSGAVLSWPIDAQPGAMVLTFTDVERADWLWRLVGESGHGAIAAALNGRQPADGQPIDVTGVELLASAVNQLRRLALGHWMRRWWPASHRDGIAALGAALLDAEVAVLTAAAQDFFADDTFDSDVAELLAPHSATLNDLVRGGDPRVVQLVGAAGELTDEIGTVLAEPVPVAPRRDDYALAAGADHGSTRAGAIAAGTATLAWAAVPPAVFDAAENTVDWHIEATDAGVNAVVDVALSGTGSPNGIPVRLVSHKLEASGVLDVGGQAAFPLLGEGQVPVPETTAWNHDWRETQVTVGVAVEESVETRDRVRAFARARLAAPGNDAFLAEILAAESDY